MEYCNNPSLQHSHTPPLQYSITPLLHHSVIARGVRPLARRLAGLVVGAGLLAVTMTGCGRSSDKAGKPPATNAAAPQAFANTNQGPVLRRVLRTNFPPAAARAAGRTNAANPLARSIARPGAPGAPARAAAKTNAPSALARTGAGTNAAPATGAKSSIVETVRGWQTNRAFYPALGILVICLCLAGVLLFRLIKSKARKAEPAAPAETAPPMAARPARKKARKVTIHSCNVLQVGAQGRHLWQFDARGRGFVLNREQTSVAGEPLPARLIAKDWRSLWQRKLNIAWLAPEQVFLRVAQFPASDFDETLSMVELQLEKLSPMPVTQIVWTIHLLPHTEGSLQTVIVMIVARNTVEEFLGQLEGQGYLADRLELPLLDQLQATAITRNGAWIYPEAPGGRNAALVAWWYGGVAAEP